MDAQTDAGAARWHGFLRPPMKPNPDGMPQISGPTYIHGYSTWDPLSETVAPDRSFVEASKLPPSRHDKG